MRLKISCNLKQATYNKQGGRCLTELFEEPYVDRWGRAGGRKSVADRHCSVDGGQNHIQTQTSPQCVGALNMPTSSIIFFPWVSGNSSNKVEESWIYERFRTEFFNEKKNTIFQPTCILGLRNVLYSQCTFYHRPVLVKLRDW